MDTNDFLKNSFFKNLNTSLKRCWEPEEICNNEPIKAHSIQNSRVLEMLCSNGHVIMPQEKIVHKGEIPIVGFTEVGRNKASIFTGLCENHDKGIFSPIDDFEMSLDNSQQLFLLAYRSVFKKFYMLSLGAKIANSIYEDQVKVGRAKHKLDDRSSNQVMIHSIRAYNAYQYKKIFDTAYLENQYDVVAHEMFSFKHKKPTVAVSALYWLSIEKPNSFQVPWIVLNVFPTKDKTHVIFSYLFDDTEYVSSAIKDVLNTSLKRRIWSLSETIIRTTDNFVISPVVWNNLSKKRRDSIVTYYRDTLFEGQSYDGNIRNLCLFELANIKH